jgi:hypothetical protein
MKELDVHTSGIAKWVEPIHIPNVSPVSHYKGPKTALMIENYTSRIEETKRKIASLIEKLEHLIYHKGLDHKDWMTQLHLIWSVLSVYDISGVKWKYKSALLGTTWPSSSTQLGGGTWSVWFTSTAKGNDWMDYFGDQSIRETGGTIIVMLSNEGVEYLNDIANTVSSITTTVTV